MWVLSILSHLNISYPHTKMKYDPINRKGSCEIRQLIAACKVFLFCCNFSYTDHFYSDNLLKCCQHMLQCV